GLRVGLAAARGLALALDIPLVGVTTLEAVAAPVVMDEDETAVSVFDARRDEVYMQVFGKGLVPLTPPLLAGLEEAKSRLPRAPLVLVGTGAALLAGRLDAPGTAYRLAAARAQPDANEVAALACVRLAAGGPEAFRVPPAPLYIRAPDAKLPGGRDPGEAA